MERGIRVLTLVRRARRRLIENKLLACAAEAASAALAALILLLLLGIEIVSWQSGLPIVLIAAGYCAYRTAHRRPSLYRAAQVVDSRLALPDTLSTALYFADDASADSEMRSAQAAHAEEVARSIDVRLAAPFTMPRAAYATLALGLVAASLFAMRYGLNRSLNLRPPIAALWMREFGASPRNDTAKRGPHTPPSADARDENAAAAAEQDRESQQKKDGEKNGESSADGEQAADKTGASKDAASKQSNAASQPAQADEEAQAENAPDSAPGDHDSSSGSQQGKQSERAQNNPKSDSGSANESPSLWSKVKDAAQNLLSRLKPQQNSQGQSQSAANQQNQQQGAGKQGAKQGESAKSGQPDGQQAGDTEDAQNSQEAQAQKDPQGKGTGKSDSRQASKQPGSGIGSQDGDKTIRQAEQLAAMGKISQILGKRSQNLTGEATVEVQSTSQQLRTEYVERGAQHTQGGAEISRDEIPVAFQSYVERYFEQMRKQAPAKKE